MLNRVITTIREIPRRTGEGVAHQRDVISRRVTWARGEGHARAWTLKTRTLERADALLDRGGELPVVGRVARPAGRAVHSRLEAACAPPVEDYDSLNAKKAARSVRGLAPVDLLKIERREQATKARKTVSDAIARERDQRRRRLLGEVMATA